ncbi:hypothetical protein AM588_10005268 [Phytophthora nicotianae]|uniref:Endonuclease/exonuclease/phosphatase domain-containing protein n=1 Tax=Phytophthora nicotianae TaxID=4792 RepID=A0A0W8D910_PHYNI|nr:hypothetical protein AM588_10005268 [Phytophthora nicotianae]
METPGMRMLPSVGARALHGRNVVWCSNWNLTEAGGHDVQRAGAVLRSLDFLPYCESSELRWKNRSKKLEVDNYKEFWAGMMKKLGYGGLFVKKTSTKPDGVAVFWNEKKLKVKESEEISLDSPSGDESDIDHELLSRASTRGSVGAIVHFEHLETQLKFIVATTHLFWDPMQEDVKLLQSRRMLRAIEEFTSSLDASTPIIFAGDFNSLPDSKVYSFITSKSHYRSAYAQYESDGEPKFTNVNGDAETDDGKMVPRFVGTLDYIFYRSPSATLTSIFEQDAAAALMELMSFEDASKEVALPSTISPSDHLPLLCEFHIQSTSN